MSRSFTSTGTSRIWGLLLVVGTIGLCLLRTVPVFADDIHATAGAQSNDKGRQALAFLPNELWVHAGDSVTWAFPTDEPHTVTFLSPNQVRPPFPVGCPPGPPPGTTPDGSSFPTTPCVNSGVLLGGPTYTVVFPTAGNFKLVCLLHENMTGVVHVLSLADVLPHDQAFYDRQARNQADALLSDARELERRGRNIADASPNTVTVGIGEILATGGGSQTASVMRFLARRIVVQVGDTVEFTNHDPVTPHTVTFGTEPADPVPPSSGVTTDSDGALRAALAAPGDSTNSGIIVAWYQDQTGAPQTPMTPTRFRVTFNQPGTYDYICALHDDLGMTGRVVVTNRRDGDDK